MCNARDVHVPEERPQQIAQQPAAQFEILIQRVADIVKQPVSQSPSFVVSRRSTGLDDCVSRRYSTISKPAGPLSQDMLSLGGSFIGGMA